MLNESVSVTCEALRIVLVLILDCNQSQVTGWTGRLLCTFLPCKVMSVVYGLMTDECGVLWLSGKLLIFYFSTFYPLSSF